MSGNVVTKASIALAPSELVIWWVGGTDTEQAFTVNVGETLPRTSPGTEPLD